MDKLQSSLQELEQKLTETLQYQARQAEFDKVAKQRFEKNLNAFETYYPALHKQIKDFVPREDFKVFVTSSGHGNYQPADAPVPIYGDDPYIQTQQQVEKNTKKAVFGRTAVYKGSDPGTRSDQRLHMRYMSKLADTYRDIIPDNEPVLNHLPEFYPTCIMFGLGLGYALTAILEKHTFDYLFICEPDFETFYASLYCTDWENILESAYASNSSVFLHVGITYEVFFEKIQAIYNDVGAFSLVSSFCYQHTPGQKINALVKEFFDHFYQIQLGYGFYNDAITGIAHTIENFNKNKCELFTPPKRRSKHIEKLTAYVVANGPSLDEAIEYIRENQDNVIIFAAGTALNTLLNVGITPDFHVLVERPKLTYEVLLETTSLDTLKNINLLAVDVMYPEVPPLYKWAGLGLKGPEAGTVLTQFEYLKSQGKLVEALNHAAPLVANTALSFASRMGFGQVYMFGVDNGYPVDGPSHSIHSVYSDPKLNKKYKVDTNVPYILEGNLDGHVKATNLMVQAKQQMEYLIKQSPNVEFYNVGSGAKLKGAHPLVPEDILCEPITRNKYGITEELKTSLFDEMSFDKPEEAAGIEELESLCDYLIEIAERPYTTRKEASDLLKAQARVVFAYKGKKFGHLFHVLKGTLLYFHVPLISQLYFYENEEKTLQWFAKTLEVWKECLKAMKEDYRQSWNKRCTYSLEDARRIKRLQINS